LGQVEIRFESGEPAPAAPAPAKKPEQSLAVPRGVQLNELDQGAKAANFNANPAFSKKSNTGTVVFIVAAIVIGVAIISIVVYTIWQSHSG
jgi:hypothetical protein